MVKTFLFLSVAVLFLFSSVTSKLPKHFFAHKGAQWYFDLNQVPRYQQAILDAHNKVRSAVGVQGLEWNSEAAKVAQRWSNGCRFEHNSNRGNYGENIAWTTIYMQQYENDKNRVMTEQEMMNGLAKNIQNWANEEKDYDYSSNSCQGVCGHYTQIVWRKTTSVGCGVTQCDNLAGGFSSFYLVCDYSPPGNWNNEQPY